jgi:hypothetical protein
MMPEAFVEPWQAITDAEGVQRNKMLVACCSEMGINLISS